jgi:autotransporter-associated beta strand protein
MFRGNRSFVVLGVLTLVLAAAGAQAQSIAVHWAGYGGNPNAFTTPIAAGAPDGIQLPDGSYNSNWTNGVANWYQYGTTYTNLQDNNGTGTTAVLTSYAVNSNCGSYWGTAGTAAGTDNLLLGPGGGNGGQGGGSPIPNVITGIPYTDYEIIAYVNGLYGGNQAIWLDSTPGTSNSLNAPVNGSRYYFSQTGTNPGFVQITNNTDPTTYTAGNYVVWTGLSGGNQTLWTARWNSGGIDNGNSGQGITGFEIVNTPPANTPTWANAVSGFWSASANWTGGSVLPPNSDGATAVFKAATSASVSIGVDEAVTVGNMTLGAGGAGGGYSFASYGSNDTLTLSNTGAHAPAQITVIDGTHDIMAPVVLNSTLVVASTTSSPWTLTFDANSGITANSSTAGLTMNAPNGTLILAGSNTYTGRTSVNSGTLVAANLISLPGAGSNLVSVAAGATLAVQTGDGTIGWSGSQIDSLVANTTWSSSASAFGIDTTNGDFTYGSNITQTLALTKLGSNTLTLTGTNVSYSGATTVSAGSLQLGDGATDVTLHTGGIKNNAGLVYNVTVSQTASYAITGAGTVYKVGSGQLFLNGPNTYSNPINVNAGGVTVNSGSLSLLNHNTGAGTSSIGALAMVGTLNVADGTVNLNSTQSNGLLVLPGTSTGTVVVGPPSGGQLPTLGTVDLRATPATGTLNATNSLAITGALKLPGGVGATISNGNSFAVTGANLANTTVPSKLSLGGGTLTLALPQSVGVHWSGYQGGFLSPVTGTDGVVPQDNWNNVQGAYFGASFSNLTNCSGATTAVGVSLGSNDMGASFPWGGTGPVPGVSNLLVGCWGNNGGTANANARANVISGISYSNYEIIAYVNNPYGSNATTWLDGTPNNPNAANTPLPGSQYYYTPTSNAPGFVAITNTTSGTYPAGNYAVWTGLSGPTQTIWQTAGDINHAIYGFQVVDTAPTTVDLPLMAIAVTSNATLDFGATGGTDQTLGHLSLTAGSGGGTQLTLQNALNVNFNGISATYPSGGTGAMTASIVGGTSAPVISLAASSTVSVDPNVTLTIVQTIGNSPAGPTTLNKTGNGTLVLTGTDIYTGGTIVAHGTLIVQDAAAIANGTSLTVGNAAAFPAPVVPASAVAPVPEPATWALLATGLAFVIGYRRGRRR